MEVTQTEEETLRRMEHDLATLAPRPSEEADLLEQRRMLAGAEKIREGLITLCMLCLLMGMALIHVYGQHHVLLNG